MHSMWVLTIVGLTGLSLGQVEYICNNATIEGKEDYQLIFFITVEITRCLTVILHLTTFGLH